MAGSVDLAISVWAGWALRERAWTATGPEHVVGEPDGSEDSTPRVEGLSEALVLRDGSER